MFVTGGSSLSCVDSDCLTSLHQDSRAACVQKVTRQVRAGEGQPNKNPVSDSEHRAIHISDTLTLSQNNTKILIYGCLIFGQFGLNHQRNTTSDVVNKYFSGYLKTLTFNLKFPADLGLATNKRSEKRNKCLGLAFIGIWAGDIAHGASIRNVLLQDPFVSIPVRSPKDFFRNDLFFWKR